MTNVDCRELLAHLHIPLSGVIQRKLKMEWFISTHLGVKAADKLSSG
jgi:hypothetical protein